MDNRRFIPLAVRRWIITVAGTIVLISLVVYSGLLAFVTIIATILTMAAVMSLIVDRGKNEA